MGQFGRVVAGQSSVVWVEGGRLAPFGSGGAETLKKTLIVCGPSSGRCPLPPIIGIKTMLTSFARVSYS